MAETSVSKEVMDDNMKQELAFIREQAKAEFNDWFFNKGGRTATEEEKVIKMQKLLNMKSGRIGIPCMLDHAWQKQKIGTNGRNSLSGHNLCCGGNTKKVLNSIVYSKLCKTCTLYRKNNQPVPEHRCSQNFDPALSSKSMEAKAAIQHKIVIDTAPTGAWMHTVLTDDDSTTRANLLHSYKALADRDYPGWNARNGCGKGGTDWPYENKVNSKTGKLYGHYYTDYGKIPLYLPAVQHFWSDVGHRVRCIAKMIFSHRYKSKNPEKVGEIGLNSWECLKLKKCAGYYFKTPENQSLPLDEFKIRSHCIYLHHFNDHSCCNISWCKVLKSQRRDNPLQLSANYKAKFRCKENDSQLFTMLKKGYENFLTDDALEQVYHSYSTNKNESLNRQITAAAPKDRHFSGMTDVST